LFRDSYLAQVWQYEDIGQDILLGSKRIKWWNDSSFCNQVPFISFSILLPSSHCPRDLWCYQTLSILTWDIIRKGKLSEKAVWKPAAYLGSVALFMLSASKKGLKNHQSESDFDQFSSTFCWCSVKYLWLLKSQEIFSICVLKEQWGPPPQTPSPLSSFMQIFQQLWNLLLFSEGSNAKVYPQTWGDTKLRLQHYCPCSNEHHHSCEKKNTWRSKTELLAIIQPNEPCRLSKVLSKPPCCIRSLQQTRARPRPNNHMINLLQWCWWNKWNLELLHPWGIESWNPSIHPNIT